MALYHIGKSGKPSICKARLAKCPYKNTSPHFKNEEKALQYADNLNSFLASNITTEVELDRHYKIHEIIDSKDYIIRLKKRKKIFNKLEKAAKEQYRILEKISKKRNKNCMSWEEFYSNFRENDQLYKAEVTKSNLLYKEFNEVIENRKQINKFYNKTKNNIIDKSFSRASSSSYIVYEKESLSKIIDELDKEDYKYIIRPDIETAPGSNFLVRFSDHAPNSYIIQKDKTKNVWDYTEASILVTYKKNRDEVLDNNKIEQKIKLLQRKNY